MATENALERPGDKNPALGTLRALCWEHFKGLEFACMADCFAAIVPKIRGSVSLDAWSSAEITVAPVDFPAGVPSVLDWLRSGAFDHPPR